MLGGLRGAQRELLQWNRERIKTGRAPAVLPARLCREAELGAWCALLPATFGLASRPQRRLGRQVGQYTGRTHPAGRIRKLINEG